MNKEIRMHELSSIPGMPRSSVRGRGFTLIELMVVAAIIAIIAAIAYPSYINSVVKSKRSAAEACLSEHANYMERFYTTNLAYDKDRAGKSIGTLPALGCDTDGGMADNYSFSFVTNFPTQSTYAIQAIPKLAQASRDKKCGTLTLNQAGTRTVSGSGTVADCW
ncbi:pilus assembly protein PilE [Halothiobacillus diazotrophicus]|uniref:Pilus assembly protein PilE n=2 Tax=Halothiobacillus diazotrophicus TaxID=1860122 RepID=A0A191ZI97_9GAMM|nr:pilus assembly protein PilE [Halothiobacillus diazotrophicus]